VRPPAHPRWLNRLWSWLGGYFWSPCPLCGRCFGGHEWREHPRPDVGDPGGHPRYLHGYLPVVHASGARNCGTSDRSDVVTVENLEDEMAMALIRSGIDDKTPGRDAEKNGTLIANLVLIARRFADEAVPASSR